MTAYFFVYMDVFAGDYAFLRIQSIVIFLDYLYDFLTVCVDFLQLKC